MARTLTPKQKAFVDEYLLDLNATQAAIRAGYSKRNADKIGAELLGKTGVSEAIQKAIAQRAARTEITQDRVLQELARIAFSDPRKVMVWGPDGVTLRPSSDLTDDEAASVLEVGETRTKDGGSLRLRQADKVKALELLAKHLGMLTEKIDLTGTLTVENMSDDDLHKTLVATLATGAKCSG